MTSLNPASETPCCNEGDGNTNTSLIETNMKSPGAKAPNKSILKRHEAKSTIEITLRKSAGVLSDFTENISQTSTYISNILAPEKFGFGTPILQDMKTRSTNTNAGTQSNPTERKNPDIIAKLPTSIVDILRKDSNSSIPSMRQSRKYHYHSKKMALKQRDDSNLGKGYSSLASTENSVPKIVLVSAPLTLQHDSSEILEDTFMTKNNVSESSATSRVPNNNINMEASFEDSIPELTKSDKLGTGTPVHVLSSAVRKPEKLNIGVEKGVAFILGPKTRYRYINTFECADINLSCNSDKTTTPLNRKWVVYIGNFLDHEISLSLMGNDLTITGFRQPSLKHPEGQTVSETISLPPKLDVHKLRMYRANDAKAFLVIQEKH